MEFKNKYLKYKVKYNDLKKNFQIGSSNFKIIEHGHQYYNNIKLIHDLSFTNENIIYYKDISPGTFSGTPTIFYFNKSNHKMFIKIADYSEFKILCDIQKKIYDLNDKNNDYHEIFFRNLDNNCFLKPMAFFKDVNISSIKYFDVRNASILDSNNEELKKQLERITDSDNFVKNTIITEGLDGNINHIPDEYWYNIDNLWNFTKIMIYSLNILKDMNYIHLDIKPQNIGYTKVGKNNYKFKIIDLGSAQKLEDIKNYNNIDSKILGKYNDESIYEALYNINSIFNIADTDELATELINIYIAKTEWINSGDHIHINRINKYFTDKYKKEKNNNMISFIEKYDILYNSDNNIQELNNEEIDYKKNYFILRKFSGIKDVSYYNKTNISYNNDYLQNLLKKYNEMENDNNKDIIDRIYRIKIFLESIRCEINYTDFLEAGIDKVLSKPGLDGETVGYNIKKKLRTYKNDLYSLGHTILKLLNKKQIQIQSNKFTYNNICNNFEKFKIYNNNFENEELSKKFYILCIIIEGLTNEKENEIFSYDQLKKLLNYDNMNVKSKILSFLNEKNIETINDLPKNDILKQIINLIN